MEEIFNVDPEQGPLGLAKSDIWYMSDDAAIQSSLGYIARYVRGNYNGSTDPNNMQTFFAKASFKRKQNQFVLGLKVGSTVGPSGSQTRSQSVKHTHIRTFTGDLVTFVKEDAEDMRKALGRQEADTEWAKAVRQCSSQILSMKPSNTSASPRRYVQNNTTGDTSNNPTGTHWPISSLAVNAQYQPGNDRLRWRLCSQRQTPGGIPPRNSKIYGTPQRISSNTSQYTTDMRWYRTRPESIKEDPANDQSGSSGKRTDENVDTAIVEPSANLSLTQYSHHRSDQAGGTEDDTTQQYVLHYDPLLDGASHIDPDALKAYQDLQDGSLDEATAQECHEWMVDFVLSWL